MKTPRLAEVCKIVNGGTPKSGVSEYWGGDIAWLTPAEMGKRLTPYIGETARTISRAGLANCSARQVPTGALIMSTRAPIGHLAIPEVPMAFNQGCRGLIPSDALDTKYLYYFLWFSRDELNELGTGTTFKELSSGALGNYQIPLPPIEKQRRIVTVLDDAFAAITTATANAEKNLANTRDLFSAGFEAMFDPSQVGWDENILPDISENLDAKRRPVTKSDRVAGDIPYFGASGQVDSVRDFLFDEDLLLVSEDGANLLMRTYPIAFSISGKSWVNNHAHILRFSDRTTQRLVEYYLNSVSVAPWVSGMAQPKLNQKSLNAIPIPLPPKEHRSELVTRLDALALQIQGMAECYQRKSNQLANLKLSLLERAFSGALVIEPNSAEEGVPAQFATPRFTAQVIAFAHYRHERQQSQKTFGHVKAQKALQLTESVGGIDLGRRPIKDAAGPNDFQHMLRATDWAVQHGFFEFVPRAGGTGYDFKKLANFDSMITDALAATRPLSAALERAIDPIVPMVSQDAEVFATVHAAWNNLLHDGKAASDDAILKEARDDWHRAKLKIPEAKFRAAIKSIRAKGLVPDGSAKYVGGQGGLF